MTGSMRRSILNEPMHRDPAKIADTVMLQDFSATRLDKSKAEHKLKQTDALQAASHISRAVRPPGDVLSANCLSENCSS